MRVVYLGTPAFSVEPLKRLLSISQIEVVGVITNCDKPVGRKQILTPPPVKVFAESMGLKVYQYRSIKKEGLSDLISLKPDLMITCAFGQILSQEILNVAKYGVYNIHASLLPKYRGPAPVQYAILNGEKETGITVMKTDIGIDTGDMIHKSTLEILENETAGELLERLSIVGADAIHKVVLDLVNGKISFTKQDESMATHTKMLKKDNAELDFSKSATEVVNKIRAYNPSPVAFTTYNDTAIKVYSAKVVDGSGEVGEVIDNNKRLVIACGIGAVEILTLQKAGGKMMDTKAFLLGNKINLKDKF